MSITPTLIFGVYLERPVYGLLITLLPPATAKTRSARHTGFSNSFDPATDFRIGTFLAGAENAYIDEQGGWISRRRNIGQCFAVTFCGLPVKDKEDNS